MSYSPAPLALDRSKPAPWNVEGAFVAPEYQGLWRGLVAVYDVGPQDLPLDLGSNKRHATGLDTGMTPGSKFLSSVGVGRAFTESDDGEGIIVPDVAVTDQITVLAVASTDYPDGTGDSALHFRHIVSRHPGWVISWTSNDGVLRLLINTGSEVNAHIANHSEFADGEPHVVGGTYDGATIQSYFDGLPANSSAQSGNIDLSGETRIAGYWDNAGFEWRGEIMLVAYWDRALTPEEVARFSADPFGLLRPNWDYVTAAAEDPANLQATVDGSDVTLSWDASF